MLLIGTLLSCSSGLGDGDDWSTGRGALGLVSALFDSESVAESTPSHRVSPRGTESVCEHIRGFPRSFYVALVACDYLLPTALQASFANAVGGNDSSQNGWNSSSADALIPALQHDHTARFQLPGASCIHGGWLSGWDWWTLSQNSSALVRCEVVPISYGKTSCPGSVRSNWQITAPQPYLDDLVQTPQFPVFDTHP